MLDKPRRVVPCAYWRCDKQAETWAKFGRTRDYCCPEHQEAAKTDRPPKTPGQAAVSDAQARIDAALELLDNPDILKLAENSQRSPMSSAYLKVRDILHGNQ